MADLVCPDCSSAASSTAVGPSAASPPSFSFFISVSVPPISSSSGSFWGLGDAGASNGLSVPDAFSDFFSGDPWRDCDPDYMIANVGKSI